MSQAAPLKTQNSQLKGISGVDDRKDLLNLRLERAVTILFFAFLFVVDWFLFFRHIEHFFQADSVFLLNYRATSVFGYVMQFGRLSASGWYRPLTQGLFESVLYPIAGLNPVPYRLPVYAIFIGCTILV